MGEQTQLITYSLKHVNGLYLPVRGRDIITLEDVDNMIAGLQATRDRMLHGETVSDIAFGESQALFNDILARGEWKINKAANEYCYAPYKAKPGVSGECVYFMLTPTDNQRIKIGCTIDLFNRTKEHHQSHEGRNPQVLALFKTPQYRQLERLLHKKFIDHHTLKRQSEWFKLQPVYDWLCAATGGAS